MNKKLDDEYYQLLEQIQAADFVLVELTLYWIHILTISKHYSNSINFMNTPNN